MGSNRDSLRLALLVAIVALVAAVIPIWPWGFYALLRLVVTGVALFAIYVVGTGDPKRTIGLVVVALLFNPIIPIHLSRLVWFPIDLGVAFWFWRIRESEASASRTTDDGASKPFDPPA